MNNIRRLQHTVTAATLWMAASAWAQAPAATPAPAYRALLETSLTVVAREPA
ncbi:MAG: hypothetical protein ACK4K3_13330 [Aquabacterium sp.]